MTSQELLAATRVQTAIMLIAYHQALNTLLNELVAALPPQYPHGRETYRGAVRRFRYKVQSMALDWYRS